MRKLLMVESDLDLDEALFGDTNASLSEVFGECSVSEPYAEDIRDAFVEMCEADGSAEQVRATLKAEDRPYASLGTFAYSVVEALGLSALLELPNPSPRVSAAEPEAEGTEQSDGL